MVREDQQLATAEPEQPAEVLDRSAETRLSALQCELVGPVRAVGLGECQRIGAEEDVDVVAAVVVDGQVDVDGVFLAGGEGGHLPGDHRFGEAARVVDRLGQAAQSAPVGEVAVGAVLEVVHGVVRQEFVAVAAYVVRQGREDRAPLRVEIEALLVREPAQEGDALVVLVAAGLVAALKAGRAGGGHGDAEPDGRTDCTLGGRHGEREDDDVAVARAKDRRVRHLAQVERRRCAVQRLDDGQVSLAVMLFERPAAAVVARELG